MRLLFGAGEGMGWLGNIFGARERITPEHVETASDFERLFPASGGPGVLYVWGDSCGPCKRMSHEVVAAATKHAGHVRFAEISTSAEPALLARLEVRATPTVIVYEGADEIGRVTGFRPAGWFDEMIATEFAER